MFGFGTTPNVPPNAAKKDHSHEQKSHHHKHHHHHHHGHSPAKPENPSGACVAKEERASRSTHDLTRHNTKESCNRLHPQGQHERPNPHGAHQDRTPPRRTSEESQVSDDHINEVLLELESFKARMENSCLMMQDLLKAKLEELEMRRRAMQDREAYLETYAYQMDHELSEMKIRFEEMEKLALAHTPSSSREKLYKTLEEWRTNFYHKKEYIEKGHRDAFATCGKKYHPRRF